MTRVDRDGDREFRVLRVAVTRALAEWRERRRRLLRRPIPFPGASLA